VEERGAAPRFDGDEPPLYNCCDPRQDAKIDQGGRHVRSPGVRSRQSSASCLMAAVRNREFS